MKLYQHPNISSSDHQQSISEDERRQRDKTSIIAALKSCNGKVFGNHGAAKLLNIKPTTLASRIKRMGINRKAFEI